MKAYYKADSAVIVGDVTIGEGSSVFYHSVVRGDDAPIQIGKGTNIQDNCVLHISPWQGMTIGDGVTVGHSVILHGCTIEDRVLVGMGAIVMNGAVIGEGSLIGAGTLVLEGQKIPPRSLVVGSPARIIGSVTEAQLKEIDEAAEIYLGLAPAQLEAVPIEETTVEKR